MYTGTMPEFPVSVGSYARPSAQQDNDHTDLVRGKRTEGTMSARMRFLHFENTFGEAHASEYCLDAMLSLVLLMMRNSKLDADRMARLAGLESAAHLGEDGLALDDGASGHEVAPVWPTTAQA